MIVLSIRHRPEDLALWQEYKEADVLACKHRLLRLEQEAIAAIRAFVQNGKAYCGVSWGKDSVAVAYLCHLADVQAPLIHFRPTNHNPDCDAVRDIYLRQWPSEYHEVYVNYSDLHSRRLPHQTLDQLTDERWYAAIREVNRHYGERHILGIRADESAGRRIRCLRWGVSSPNGCAPIAFWSCADVFAYLCWRNLPIHPAYAMLGGGRWPREKLRVAEIGDTHGTGGGRRQWEEEYYPDVLRRIEA